MNRSDKGPQQIGQGLDAALARLQAGIKERHRQRVEAAARPGETYEQTEARLRDEDAEKEQREARAKIERQQAAIAAGKGTKEEAKPVPSSVRKPPAGDEQADFFVPGLYDVGSRDSRHIMDVAPFRLSKDQKRAGEVIRYELSDGYVEVKAGPDGMASVWDYDIVLTLHSLKHERVFTGSIHLYRNTTFAELNGVIELRRITQRPFKIGLDGKLHLNERLSPLMASFDASVLHRCSTYFLPRFFASPRFQTGQDNIW